MRNNSYFVGLDVHKQVIAYCVKTASGEIVREGKMPATRAALDEWVKTLPGPWRGGMEATMFNHWIPLPEASRRGTADGAPGADEGDHGGEKQE